MTRKTKWVETVACSASQGDRSSTPMIHTIRRAVDARAPVGDVTTVSLASAFITPGEG